MRFLIAVILTLSLCVSTTAQLYTTGGPNWQVTPTNVAPPPPTNPTASQITFTFTLTASVRTSSGVFDATGALVRTLWRNRYYNPGTYTDIWDGKDDAGNPLGAGTYTVKVLNHSVTYNWDGMIGNTSNAFFGPHIWETVHSYTVMSHMAFINGKGYSASGYIEGAFGSGGVFDEATPNTPSPLNTSTLCNTACRIMDVVTDGNVLYYTMQNGSAPSFVFAMNPAGQFYGFTAGTVLNNIWSNGPPLQVIDNSFNGTKPVTQPTGIAVQRGGNILAVSHGASTDSGVTPSLDVINLFNKVTGASLGTIAFTNPQQMTFDTAGSLWVINGTSNTLVKIDNVGTTNDQSTPITGLSKPLSVASSQVSGSLFVMDGGASQQIKEYGFGNVLLNTIGTLGGYTSNGCDPTVTNTKYNFELSFSGFSDHPFISVDDVGNIWFFDMVNLRVMHFQPNGTYINRIMSDPPTYQISVSRTDPTREFHYLKEYQIDYSKPLLPGDADPAVGGNGAWTLVRNWSACQTTWSAVRGIEKFSNGLTYGYVFSGFGGSNALVEFPATGPLRNTNANPINPTTSFQPIMNPDGAFTIFSNVGPAYTVTKKAVINYSGNNPVYDTTGVPIATFSGTLANGDPIPGGYGGFPEWTPTTGGILPVRYNDPNVTAAAVKYHLGGVPVNGSGFKFKTETQLTMVYPDGLGSFQAVPANGGHSGLNAKVAGRNIFTGYDGQATGQFGNQYGQWWEDGLFIGQFGNRSSDGQGLNNILKLAPSGWEENIQNFQVVQVSGDIYLYHGAEGIHHGAHRWHISNLASIHELGASGALGSSLTLVPIF